MEQEDFKKLKDLWYSRLKEDGFEDIEKTSLDEPLLKQFHSQYFHFSKHTEESISDMQEWFDFCSDFLHRYHDWKSRKEKLVWEYYCQGHSQRTISKLLESEHQMKAHNTSVHFVLAKLTKILKSLSWVEVHQKQLTHIPFLRSYWRRELSVQYLDEGHILRQSVL